MSNEKERHKLKIKISKKEIEKAGVRYSKRKYGHCYQESELCFEAGAEWYKKSINKKIKTALKNGVHLINV